MSPCSLVFFLLWMVCGLLAKNLPWSSSFVCVENRQQTIVETTHFFSNERIVGSKYAILGIILQYSDNELLVSEKLHLSLPALPFVFPFPVFPIAKHA